MRSPAFSLLVGMVFSIEICPLEPVSVIADELTSSLRLDKIGIAFLVAIARFVASRAWRKRDLLMENFRITTPLFINSIGSSSSSRDCG